MSESFSHLSKDSGGGVIIDLGTGDGRFVYQSAKEHPERFYIGVDAASESMREISQKIYKKPAKGGLKNALFVQAAVEDLPADLNAVADEVHVHFPWGSLLKVMAVPEEDALRGVRRICRDGGLLEVVIGLDEGRDKAEWQRLGLVPLTAEYLEQQLVPAYARCGFAVDECGVFDAAGWPDICTSWAKRLKFTPGRQLFYLVAEAV